MAGRVEDAVGLWMEGAHMRYKVGAEQLGQTRSLAQRPDGVFNSARTVPVGPTHAVDATTGAVACGIKVEGLQVLDQDWEEAFFVEKCPGCFAAVPSHGGNKGVGGRSRGVIPRRKKHR
jgi:hypothetical protein